MRVLFLSDPLFTRYESELISRLAVGLADEGVNIAWGLPEGTDLSTRVLTPVVPYLPARLGLTPARRGAALLRRAKPVLGGDPDVVHLFGGGISRLGAEVVRGCAAVPAFEIWRPGLEASIRAVINRVAAGVTHRTEDRALIVATNRDVRERYIEQFPRSVVRAIPWGVYTHEQRARSESGAMGLVLLGPGRDAKAWASAFRACLRTLRGSPTTHLFADSSSVRKYRLWSKARDAGVVGRVTLIDAAETQRELLLSADLVLYPDARGEVRTVLLDAMGAGVAVIASADPRSHDLIDGKTARLVVDSTEAQWHEAIEMMTHDHTMRRGLTETARAHVREHHRVSRQIASLVDAYEWIAGAGERIETVPAIDGDA